VVATGASRELRTADPGAVRCRAANWLRIAGANRGGICITISSPGCMVSVGGRIQHVLSGGTNHLDTQQKPTSSSTEHLGKIESGRTPIYGEYNLEPSVKIRLQHNVVVEVLEGVHMLETEPGRASVQTSLLAIPKAESHGKGLGAYRAKGLVTSNSKPSRSSTCSMLS